MKVLIIQPQCPHYRVALFELLAQKFGGFDFAHFGSKVFQPESAVNELQLKKKTFLGITWIIGLNRIVKNYDVIITVFDPHWINAFLLSIFHTTRIIYWGHGMGRSLIINVLRRKLIVKSRSTIVYDYAGKNNLIKLGVPPEKIHIAHNTQHVPNSEDLSDSTKDSFIFVGRLQKRKKLEDFIIAFALQRDRLPPSTRIVIIGDGVLRQQLEKIVRLNGISGRVDFLNGTSDEEVLKKHYAKAYAYVSPGHVGLGVIHSFSYGVPVITYKGDSHAPEYSNIAHMVNGLIVDPNVESLGKALVDICDEHSNLGKNAFKHFKLNRSLKMMVKTFEESIANING